MLGAPVPIATIDEHSHLGASEDEVGRAPEIGHWTGIDEVAVATAVQEDADTEFRRRVGTLVGSHDPLGVRAACSWSRRQWHQGCHVGSVRVGSVGTEIT
jgi:hypothetical protein